MKIAYITCPFLLLLFTGCGQSSSNSELSKELKTITSWAATAHMVTEAWTQGAVPQAYATQTLEKAQQEVATEQQQLASAPAVPSLPQQLQQLDQIIHQLTIAIDHQDKGAIKPLLQQLDQIEQPLNRLAQKVEQT